MLTDAQLKTALGEGLLKIDPFDEKCLQPASYDFRVGRHAFSSSSKEVVDVEKRGVLVIEAGDFAVLEVFEDVEFGPQVAAQLGLRSAYARKGLLMLSGPQADPGFRGVLVVRIVNLAPSRISLPFKDAFLTAQFFKLSEPVKSTYSGARQEQAGISPTDIHELTQTEGLTLGEMVNTLTTVARDVAELRGSVSKMTWLVPLFVGGGIAIMAVIACLK